MLRNIRLHTFFVLNDEEASLYQYTLGYLRPQKSIVTLFGRRHAKLLADIPFHQVEEIHEWIHNPTADNLYKIFACFFGINKIAFYNLRIVQFYTGLNYIASEIEKWESIKNNALASESDPDLEQAGIDKLSKYEGINILFPVAREFATPLHEVEKWKYADVIIPFCFLNEENQIRKKLIEIKNRKPTIN